MDARPSEVPAAAGRVEEPLTALELSPQAMRVLGYRVIDMLVEHFAGLAGQPVTRTESRAALAACLDEPLPQQGTDPHTVLDQVQRDVLSHIMHLDHPRCFAFVPGPGNFIGAMADLLGAGFNVFAGTWLEASGPAQVELVVVEWLRRACGLPASAGGLFVSGGSVGNLTALAAARHTKLGSCSQGAVIYCSDQTHSSVDRAVRVLGFDRDQLRRLATDDRFRLDMSALRSAVAEDRAAGRNPFCVIANAGTTNTGAIDCLPMLADYCHREQLWLHVDGAYGAAAVLSERGRALLVGLGYADSLVLDPHKWLFQPYEIGCVLLREVRWLREAFHILPEYLQDVEERDGEVNFCDRGLQLTRSFRALKLWMSLKVFGAAHVGEAIDRGFALAEVAQEAVCHLPGWEVVTPAQMGIVTFRCAPPGMTSGELDRLNRRIVQETMADGFAAISSTVLRGQTVLRMCSINPRANAEDVRETIRRLGQIGQRLAAS